jgi:beta-lactamase regulating signal transducer with metallopeptidase domain
MNLSFFLEMAWKSSFIAGVALLLTLLLKSRAPADRAKVLQVGLLLLILLPLVSLFLPAWQVEMAAAQAQQPLVGTLLQLQQAAPAIESSAPYGAAMSEASVSSRVWDDPTLIVAILYLGGLLIASARLIGGLVTLRRWTLAAEPVSCPYWTEALERVAGASERAPAALLVSGDVPAPLSWGWRKPVILVDADAYRRGEDAEAIIAHEMAHVARGDWPALMLSRVAAALFWFNPLVWLLGRAFIRHAEEAADCHALAQVEPTHYAQALLGCAGHASRRAVPANSIASSDLAKRVHAILEGSARSVPSGSRLCAATILGCLAVAGPVSAMKLIPGAAAKVQASFAPLAPEAPAPVRNTIAAAPVRPALPAPKAVAAIAPAVAAVAAPNIPPAAAAPAAVAPAPVAAPAPAAPVQLAALAAAAAEAAAPSQRNDRSEYEAAMREARMAGAEAARAGERAARAGERAAVIARREARKSMAAGAVNMEQGAENMKQGARHMAEEAVKLRDPAYREQQIAREAARGRRVTHQELIDAIPQLEKGSREMVKGAEEMRRGAEQMRRSAENQ